MGFRLTWEARNVKTIILVVLLMLPATVYAQSKIIPVAVSHDGEDAVGKGVAFALKEALRSSKGFKLVDFETAPKTPRINVILVSLDEAENTSKPSGTRPTLPRTPSRGR